MILAGVVLILKYGQRFFRAAFKPTGEEKLDLNAVKTFVLRTENTIDGVMGWQKGVDRAG